MVTEARIEIRYPTGVWVRDAPDRLRFECWVFDESLYCPNCGETAVWVEDSPGDYYYGPEQMCIACEHTFAVCNASRIEGGIDAQRLAAIKKAAGRD